MGVYVMSDATFPGTPIAGAVSGNNSNRSGICDRTGSRLLEGSRNNKEELGI